MFPAYEGMGLQMSDLFTNKTALAGSLSLLAGLLAYLTDPDFSRFSLIAAGASLLFWGGWLLLLWDSGVKKTGAGFRAAAAYFGGLSAVILALDATARFGWFSSLLPVYARMFAGMLLFGANYLMTYPLGAFGVSEWWGTAALVAALLAARWIGGRAARR